MKALHLLPLLLLGVLAGPASPQTALTLLKRGQSVPGVGTITSIDKFAINDSGEWLALVDTNATEDKDMVVLRNGFLTLQEGTILGTPQGTKIKSIRSLNIDAAGNSYWDVDIEGSPTVAQGVYFNTKKVILQADLVNTVGYSRSAVWLLFNGTVKANSANQFIVGAQVADPSIPGGSDDALVLVTTDGKANIITTADVGHESGLVPTLGYPTPVGSVGVSFSDPTSFDLNDRGDVLWQARFVPPSGGDRAVFLNERVLARTGENSPVPGFTWLSLTNVRLALNDKGDWTFQGGISGPQNQRGVLIRNGQLIVRERTSFPAISPYLIDNFASKTPVLISNTGEVVYRAQWTGPNTTDTGILVDKEIIVQENVTKLDDLFVDVFVDSADAIAISPGGRYVLFRVDLEDGSSVVGFLDLGTVTPIVDCAGNTGRLFRSKGFPVTGKTVTLAMDKGQGIGVTPFLMVSDQPISTYPPCGIPTGFGELVIDFGNNGNPFLVKLGNPYLGAPVPINLAIANMAGLIDKHVYAQGIFFNVGNNIPGVATFLLTNAVDIEIGAP